MNSQRNSRRFGFTLLELIVVLVILGVISLLAMVRYKTGIKEMRETEAVNQLKAIHAVNEQYYQRSNPSYYVDGTNLPLEGAGGINESLGLSIFANSIDYRYTRLTTSTYTATANIPDGFSVTINQDVVGANNPCCSSGTCPTLPACT